MKIPEEPCPKCRGYVCMCERKTEKECWYCFKRIGKNHIVHTIVRGKNRKSIYYCSLECLRNQIKEYEKDEEDKTK